MPLQATSGAASYDGFGGGVPYTPTYIEDVFSTWLYTGNGTFSPKTGVNTITNGIDLAGKGGLVWAKIRDSTGWHSLFDTNRGVSRVLSSNATDAQSFVSGQGVTSFNSNGFTLEGNLNGENRNGFADVAWTFRKQPKFFDVVTYTGNGTSQTINHNLGSVPGCIIVKNLDGQNNWRVYHRSLGATKNLQLNLTDAENTNSGVWNDTAPTSTQFTVGSNGNVNRSGEQHVAYLFAHDAGGFGLTGTDNVISCGSFTTNSNGEATVSLGYEPQWMIAKRTDSTGNWFMIDTMRGWNVSGNNDVALFANTSAAEVSGSNYGNPTATGFFAEGGFANSATYIYIAIRRGPMKTPTTGTSVLSVKTYTATNSSATVTHDVTFDAEINANRDNANSKFLFVDSLRGINGQALISATTDQEVSYPTYWSRSSQRTMGAVSAYDSWWAANAGQTNGHISYGLVRAPGFFDVVCYTGTGTATTQAHNLRVVPEMIIAKSRSNAATAGTGAWPVYHASITNPQNNVIYINLTDPSGFDTTWNLTAPTSSAFSISGNANISGWTYVAYLFASCPGVSKVGSYTGNGSSQTINMGFTGGARFFLVKRTDSTGDWWVYDSVRGIVAANDPALRLNSTAAEVTSADAVDTASVGLIVNQESTCNINVNGATYIYLGIA